MIDAMSHAVFTENEEAIFAQVRTILASKSEFRRKMRLLAIYEKGTNELVAEIFRTTFGPVVACRSIDWTEAQEPINGQVRIGYQTSASYNNVQPLTGDDADVYQLKSHAAWHHLSGQDLRCRTSPGDRLTYH